MSVLLKWDTGNFSDRLRARIDIVHHALGVQMNNEMIGLAAYIVREKLSGQVLQHRLGVLAGSVRPMRTVVSETGITAGVQAGGKAAPYAIFQEYGTEDEYEILPGILTGKSDKKALAFMPSGEGPVPMNGAVVNQIMRKMTHGSGNARARAIGQFNALDGVVVRIVLHHPPIKERSFMRTSMDEWQEGMNTRLRNVFIEAVRGKDGGGENAGG